MALYLGQNKVKFNLGSRRWILHINELGFTGIPLTTIDLAYILNKYGEYITVLEDDDALLYSSNKEILMSASNEYLIGKQ